jgi:transposase-like protein
VSKPDGPKPTTKRGSGRPTKFTPTRVDGILNAIRNGATRNLAARLNGITEDTIYDWNRQGEADKAAGRRTAKAKFSDDLSRADEEQEFLLIGAVMRGTRDRQVGGEWIPGDWRAALSLLKSKFPERYSENRDLTRLLEREFELKERMQERLATVAEAMVAAMIASGAAISPEQRMAGVRAYVEGLRALEGESEPVARLLPARAEGGEG